MIEWADPPPGARSREWSSIADALRARPDQWAIVKDFTDREVPADHGAHLAYQIKRGLYVAFRPAGTFEAVSRLGKVYARYVGNGDAS